LVAADELTQRGIPVEVFEASPFVGGLARSFRDEKGFSNDFGAHFITNRLAAALGVGDRCRTVRYYGESVWLDDSVFSYPFGLLRRPRFVLSAMQARAKQGREPGTVADLLRQRYGQVLSMEVAEPLIEAWSGLPATRLAPSVADKLSTSIPKTIWLRAAGRATRRAVAIGYCKEQPESANVWHVYPKEGVSLLVNHLARRVSNAIRLQTPVEGIVVDNGAVRAVVVNGEERPVAAAISTAPVNVLPKIVRGTDDVSHLASFRYRPMVLVNLRFQGRNLMPDVVTWTPGKEVPFFRVTEAPMSMPWLAPEGKTILTVDIGCEVGDDTWSADDESLATRCLKALEPIVPSVASRYLGNQVLRTPIAYPVFDINYEAERRILSAGTGIRGLLSVGRNGEFDHLLMEDLYWRTLRRVRQLAADLS
jgi:protoporphyrinogen/coproporphyrinogen III oxidase